MAKPTATEIRGYLEEYGITTTVLSDAWIELRRDSFIIPWVERKTGQTFEGITERTDYYSGNGSDTLILNKRNIISVENIRYVSGIQDFTVSTSSVELLTEEGILKSKSNVGESSNLERTFPRGTNNIKVTYKYGFADYPDDIKEAIIYLTCEVLLGQISNRTGGGDLSTQGYTRSYGPRGKYTHIRNDLKRQAFAMLRNYSTGVVGA